MDSSNGPWADAPFTLIPTPGRGKDLNKLDDTVWIAREMANAHNGMLRALNSIYQQCIYVKEPRDVKDLLLYVTFWCDWIHEHHEGEESFLFPRVEEITGVEGLMKVNITQHQMFMNGLEEMKKYAKKTKAEEYDGMELRGIIDGFGGNLTKHLTEEIETLLGLKTYDGPELKKAYVGFDDEMRKGDKVNRIYPFKEGVLIYGRAHCFRLCLVHQT
jgi:hemerythrin-like domain-containing protein